MDNILDWMKLGANIIGGCCQIGPDMIKKISMKITLTMFEAVQARQEEEQRNQNPDHEWPSISERLKKPAEDRSKQKGKTTSENERY